MSLPCKIVTSFLLIFNVSSKGAVSKEIRNALETWGALGQDIDLDIPSFQMSDDIDDIRWEKTSDKKKIAQFRKEKTFEEKDTYKLFKNGTLKIKHLKIHDQDSYKVSIYDTNGKNVLEKTFDLKIQERVSKPKISWTCINTTLICEVMNGTDPELNLYQDGKHLKLSQRVITHKWTTNLSAKFKCTAGNKVSKESRVETVSCTGGSVLGQSNGLSAWTPPGHPTSLPFAEKGLDIYLIIGICGGGSLLMVFVTLLVFYITKRKKQRSRRNDEELEIRAHRAATEERGRKPHQIPASTPQNPAASQHPPPPPGHRSQAPSHRPLPPGHRVQHQPQKRPPAPSGTQVHQQKGPPLPRPRVQPKPPQGAAENSLSPSSN
ncbi:T-cell surface antigen CD2 isoform X1 [Chlorocebus sabaeus]|uniref:T-cell surface antigen CD2 isoform X1 n=1 Tax=Chlorocebus sabaeus TaxID=60711 RepID=UPI00045D7154|nr:T-cell surface antigen CD2 isoform X1 [Chlorocebus sabaeus]